MADPGLIKILRWSDNTFNQLTLNLTGINGGDIRYEYPPKKPHKNNNTKKKTPKNKTIQVQGKGKRLRRICVKKLELFSGE